MFIEFNHSIALRIFYRVCKHGRADGFFHSALEALNQLMPIENVIAQNKGTGFTVDKVGANDKGLRNPFMGMLHGILDIQPPAAAITQELFKPGRILRRGDHQNVAYPCQHQR